MVLLLELQQMNYFLVEKISWRRTDESIEERYYWRLKYLHEDIKTERKKNLQSLNRKGLPSMIYYFENKNALQFSNYTTPHYTKLVHKQYSCAIYKNNKFHKPSSRTYNEALEQVITYKLRWTSARIIQQYWRIYLHFKNPNQYIGKKTK